MSNREQRNLPFGPACTDRGGVVWEPRGTGWGLVGTTGDPVPAEDLAEHGPFTATEQTATARKLYPAERLATKDLYQLANIAEFTKHDAETETVIYGGLARAETIATAQLSHQDVMDELHGRALDDWSRSLGLLD